MSSPTSTPRRCQCHGRVSHSAAAHYISFVFLNTEYAKLRLSYSTAHGYAEVPFLGSVAHQVRPGHILTLYYRDPLYTRN
jgi:hypothetical protein